jgi:acetoin:2,6-dichlorophenolindophenol oxidoreductase subunit alpha
MGRAVDRARQGGGPTLVEAKTYRYSGHSRSDKATYRPEGELDLWLARDPVTLFGEKLVTEGLVTKSQLDDVWSQTRAALEETLEKVLASPAPTTVQMLSRVSAGQR